MDTALRFISISHRTASLTDREYYHVDQKIKRNWVSKICHSFDDIKGLLILVTCNRTEIYFESSVTSASLIRDFIIQDTTGYLGESSKPIFQICDSTKETVKHLLEVSSGLASTVLGDAEIIHQIKMAYHQSSANHLQGSLLERCMQTVFKTHKRISNETSFRDGTTSVAYKTIKVIANTFNTSMHDTLKILFIGAGDIVRQLFNYNNKIGFKSVYVANRTVEKAEDLVQSFGGEVYNWEKVIANNIGAFDVVVSAVSNCPDLVKRVGNRSGKTLLIDLAVPGNISKKLSRQSNITYYDLDTISAVLKDTQNKRLTEIGKVEGIISEDHRDYMGWLENASLRKYLAEYKDEVNQWVVSYLDHENKTALPEITQLATNRIVRRSLKDQGKKISEREMEMIVEEHLQF